MRFKKLLLASVLGLAIATPAAADTVCEWMDFARKALPQGSGGSPLVTAVRTGEGDHLMTKAALAMFEAVNAIDHRYRSYVDMPMKSASADQQVAGITAVYTVLSAQPGVNKTDLDGNYALAMAGVPEGAAKSDAIAIGKAAAEAVLKIGDLAPARTLPAYRPVTTPGQWVPTALPFGMNQMPAYRPWLLKSAQEVRPGPPPALTSERYARDFNEVKKMGARDSKDRSQVETLMARYRITPEDLPALRNVTDRDGRSMVDNARLFALYGMMQDDLGIAYMDSKLHYSFWRPITAIRNADKDGNPATEMDPNWLPLMNTPNHGEYPCGHCMNAGAVAELMTRLGGAKPAWGVRIGSSSIPSSAVQVLPDWNEWARQVSYSRTLGGVHYRFSNEAGEQIGRNLARLTLERVLQPLAPAEVRPAS
ncbi:vanadium-dependent haloperoxidase [Sphingomonas humi]|uniref:Vanadium-dependent haloperoxidase n=1 Tax=Sphingomonas humi TaxID=335630 RepID=A0ABP7RWB1_9SPHN